MNLFGITGPRQAFALSARVEPTAFRKQLRELEKNIRRKVMRRIATKGGQAYVAVAKAQCPIRDTSAALQAAKVKVGTDKKVTRKVGSASFTEFSDKKGRLVTITYKGGLLRKAQGYKVKQYKGVMVAICGTRDGFAKQIGVRQQAGVSRGGDARRGRMSKQKQGKRRMAQAGDKIWANPSNYAHLVIGGTKHSRAHPFHRNASAAANKATMEAAKAEVSAAIAEAARA